MPDKERMTGSQAVTEDADRIPPTGPSEDGSNGTSRGHDSVTTDGQGTLNQVPDDELEATGDLLGKLLMVPKGEIKK